MCTRKAQRVSKFEVPNDKPKMCLEYVVLGFCFLLLLSSSLSFSYVLRLYAVFIYYLCCSFSTTYVCTLYNSLFCLSMYNMTGILLQLNHHHRIILIILYACIYMHTWIHFFMKHNTNIISWCTLVAIEINL